VDDLRELAGRASPEFDRRVFAALADVEERRGAPTAAREALGAASLGGKNEAARRYYVRVAERLSR